MLPRQRVAIGIALALLLVPLATSAQQQAPPSQEVQQWVQEIQQLQAQLEPVQAQALQDTVLQQEQQDVAGAVRAAMIEADPENGKRLDRMEQLMEEARAAQEAGNTEKIGELTKEAQQLQPQLQAAQADALAKPEIETRVEAFQTKLYAKMIEIDPDAKESLDRIEELNKRVQRALSGNG